MKKSNHNVAPFSIYTVIIYAIIISLCVMTLYPFVFTLAGSFNNGIDYGLGGVWLYPRKFTLANYQVILSDPLLYKVIVRTVLVTVASVLTHVFFTSLVAFAMSRKELKCRNFFWNYALVTMFFGGGMIPGYLLIRMLKLYDTYFVYVIPGMFSVYNMIIISNFFSSIDKGMRESAYIDGASELRVMIVIGLPMVVYTFFTVFLLQFIAYWNDYQTILLFLPSWPTLSLALYELSISTTQELNNVPARMAGSMAVMIPTLLIFMLFSNRLMGNVSLGGVKE